MIIQDRVLIREADDKVQPCPELEEVPQFKRLWQRDRGSTGDSQGRKKLMAKREFAYIFHMCSYKSPYAAVPEYDRHKVVSDDIMPKDWEPDQTLLSAMAKYQILIKTPSLALVEAGQEAINSLADYLRGVNFDPTRLDKDDCPIPVANIKDVVSAISKIGDLTESLKQLHGLLSKEQDLGNQVRRGVTKTRYNDPNLMSKPADD